MLAAVFEAIIERGSRKLQDMISHAHHLNPWAMHRASAMAASREGKLGRRTNLSSTTVSNQDELKGGGSLCTRCLSHVEQR